MRTFTLYSVALFIVLFALGWFPGTGIFLMFFGGVPTGLALIAIFVSIGIDCMRGALPRALVILPVMAFAGYYMLYFGQMVEIVRYEQELKSSNPGRLLDFDPRRQHSLVVAQSTSLPGHYQIPVVYQRNENIEPQQHLSYRAHFGATCETRSSSRSLKRRVIRVRVQSPSKGYRVPVEGICVIRAPERPRGEIVEVRTKDQRIWEYRTTMMEGSFTLVHEGKELRTYRTASIRRLLPYPLPRIGCGLNSAAPSWDCFAVFATKLYRLDDVPYELADAGAKNPIAIMLGIQPRQFEGL